MTKRKESTIAALLEDKPKRGRPRHPVGRKNVYVALTSEQKQQLKALAKDLPEGLSRADIPDMAINLLAARMDLLRSAVADRDREIPEGITDLDSLYLLWDLPLPPSDGEPRWTSIRLSPQQSIELGRAHGALNALFGANRSQVFALSLTALANFLQEDLSDKRYTSIDDVNKWFTRIYL
jgi:hypothetical protein